MSNMSKLNKILRALYYEENSIENMLTFDEWLTNKCNEIIKSIEVYTSCEHNENISYSTAITKTNKIPKSGDKIKKEQKNEI